MDTKQNNIKTSNTCALCRSLFNNENISLKPHEILKYAYKNRRNNIGKTNNYSFKMYFDIQKNRVKFKPRYKSLNCSLRII